MKEIKKLKKYILPGILLVLAIGGLLTTANSQSNNKNESAEGEGKFVNEDGSKSKFSFSARRNPNGKVTGQATLRNPSFKAGSGQNETLKIEITCLKVVGKLAVFGGVTKKKNNQTDVEAAYFAVEESENKNETDKIFRGFFFDDDPTTRGEANLCQSLERSILVLEPIAEGKIQVKDK